MTGPFDPMTQPRLPLTERPHRHFKGKPNPSGWSQVERFLKQLLDGSTVERWTMADAIDVEASKVPEIARRANVKVAMERRGQIETTTARGVTRYRWRR
jgi:hypothetical protein